MRKDISKTEIHCFIRKRGKRNIHRVNSNGVEATIHKNLIKHAYDPQIARIRREYELYQRILSSRVDCMNDQLAMSVLTKRLTNKTK